MWEGSQPVPVPDPPEFGGPLPPVEIGPPGPIEPPPGFVPPPEVYDPLTKYGKDIERKVMEEYRSAPRPRDVPPPEVHAQRERDLMNQIRERHGMPRRELDPNSHESLWRPGCLLYTSPSPRDS